MFFRIKVRSFFPTNVKPQPQVPCFCLHDIGCTCIYLAFIGIKIKRNRFRFFHVMAYNLSPSLCQFKRAFKCKNGLNRV